MKFIEKIGPLNAEGIQNVYLSAILMPNGEILHLGRTIGYFTGSRSHLWKEVIHKDVDNTKNLI